MLKTWVSFSKTCLIGLFSPWTESNACPSRNCRKIDCLNTLFFDVYWDSWTVRLILLFFQFQRFISLTHIFVFVTRLQGKCQGMPFRDLNPVNVLCHSPIRWWKSQAIMNIRLLMAESSHKNSGWICSKKDSRFVWLDQRHSAWPRQNWLSFHLPYFLGATYLQVSLNALFDEIVQGSRVTRKFLLCI